MEGTLCLYNQSGFCRYGDMCRKHHVHEVCSTSNCKNKSCRQRHPKPCRHFKTEVSCKFGDLCAYKHETSTEQRNVNDLVNKLKVLEDTVNYMNIKIGTLETEIQNIKNKKVSQTSEFSCEKCDYKASSNTVLKRHTTNKHKHISFTPEKDRSVLEVEDIVKVVSPSEKRSEPQADLMERAEALFCPPPPVDTDLKQHTPQELKTSGNVNNSNDLKCDICEFTASSSKSLHGHKKIIHEEKENVSCKQCDYSANNAEHLKQHMYLFHTPSQSHFNWLQHLQ